METQHYYRRGGLIWPVILIGAGVVFLLNNLGVLGWGVWETLFRMWPVLLIAIGLDILVGRRSAWGSLVIALLLLVLLVVVVWLGAPGWNTGAQIDHTETINQALNGAKQAEIQITFGAGVLDIGALTENAGLIEGKAALVKGETLTKEVRSSGDTIYFTLRSRGGVSSWTTGTSQNNRLWQLGLSRDVPMSLHVDSGVSEATLNLVSLHVTDLTLNSGVGRVVLTLPRSGKTQVRVDGGVGEMVVRVPQAVGARIQVDGGLGGVNVNDNYRRDGNTYTSPDFNSAQNRADIHISGGIGRVVVEPMPSE